MLHLAGGGQAVHHLALNGRHRCLAGDQPIKHRCHTVNIGVSPLKLLREILFRCRIALIQLGFQFTSQIAQAQCRITAQAGQPALGNANVIRRNAPMHQSDLVQGGHAFHHRLHQAAGFLRKQRAAS